MDTTERIVNATERPLQSSSQTPQRIEAVTLFDVRPKLNDTERTTTEATIRNTIKKILKEGEEVITTTPDENLKDKLLEIATNMTRGKQAIEEKKHTSQDSREEEENLAKLQKEKEVTLKKALEQHIKKTQTTLQPLIKEIILKIQAERKLQGKPPYTKDAIVMLIYEIVYGDYLWEGKGRKDGGSSYFRSHLRAAVDEHINHGLTGLARIFSAIKHDDLEDLEIHRLNCSKEESVKRDIKIDWLFCDELYETKLSEGGQRHLPKVKSDTTTTVKAVTKVSEKKSSKESPAQRRARDEENLIALYNAIIENGYAGTVKVLEQIQNLLTLDGLPSERQKEKLLVMLRHYGILAKILELERAYDFFAQAGLMQYVPEESVRFHQAQQTRMAERLGLNGNKKKSILLEQLLRSTTDKTPAEIVTNRIQGTVGEEREKTRDRINAVLKPKIKKVVSIEIKPASIGTVVDLQKMLKEKENYKIEIPEQDPLFEVVIIVKNPKDITETVGNVIATLKPENFSGSVGNNTETYLGNQKEEQYPDKGAILHLRDNNLGGTVKIRINSTTAEAKTKRGINIDQKHPIPPMLRRQLQEAMREAKQSGLPILDVITETVQGRIIVHTDATKRQKVLLPKNGTALDLAGAIPGDKGHKALLAPSEAVITRQKVNGDYHEQRQDPLSQLEDGDLCLIHIETTESFDIGWLTFCGDPSKIRVILKEARMTERDIKRKVREERPDIEITIRERMPGAEKKDITSAIQKEIEKRIIAKRKIANIKEGQQYVQKLQHIFGFNEADLIPITCMHRTHNEQLKTPFDERLEQELKDIRELEEIETDEILIQHLKTRGKTAEGDIKTKLNDVKNSRKKSRQYREKKERTLSEIGQGLFNPLRTLAPYFNRCQPLELTLIVNDVIGAFSRITGELSKHNINIAHNESTPIANSTPPQQTLKLRVETFPPAMNNYEILKLVLKLSYDKDVRDIQQCNPDSFVFPDYMEPMIEAANTWENLQETAA